MAPGTAMEAADSGIDSRPSGIHEIKKLGATTFGATLLLKDGGDVRFIGDPSIDGGGAQGLPQGATPIAVSFTEGAVTLTTKSQGVEGNFEIPLPVGSSVQMLDELQAEGTRCLFATLRKADGSRATLGIEAVPKTME